MSERPERCCPACGGDADAATCPTAEGATPEPGNLSVCLYCGTTLCFQEDLSLRVFAPQEERALPFEMRRDLARARRAVEWTRAAHPELARVPFDA